MRNHRALLAGTAWLALASAVDAGGIESFWIPEGGDFHEPSNWDGPVPDETVAAIFDVDLEIGPFIFFDQDAVSNRIVIRSGLVYLIMWDTDPKTGNHISHAIEAVNPTVITPSIVIAENAGEEAGLVIDSGHVTCQSMVIAGGPGSVGTVELNELFGLTPSVTCALQLHVGSGGEGSFLIEDQVVVTTDDAILGVDEGSSGEVTVTDPGSRLDASGELTVGLAGAGVLTVSDEANMTSASAVIGQMPGSSGEVIVDGLGVSWFIDGSLDVGFQGTGALTITDALVLTAEFAVIGTFPEPQVEPETGGTGVVTISGPTAFWGIDGDLHVGLLWDGTLNVFDGAAVASQNGFVNPVGRATIQGPGSAWSNVGELTVGATLTGGDGGIVIADEVAILADGVLHAPGGVLTIDGDLLIQGELQIELAGADPGSFGTVSVLGDTSLSSAGLDVDLIDGFVPQAGDQFEVLTADSVSGGFDTVSLPALPPPLLWIVNQEPDSIELLVSKTGDIDGDGEVEIDDFLALLAAWGPCPQPCPPSCPADLDEDCEVGINDLLILIANWG